MLLLRMISLLGLVASILLIIYGYTIWIQSMAKIGVIDWSFIYYGLGLDAISIIFYFISSKRTS
jgi:hypothetical protein